MPSLIPAHLNEFNKMFNNLSFHKQYKLIWYLQLNINGHTRSPQLCFFHLLPKSLANEGYLSWWTLLNKRRSSSSALWFCKASADIESVQTNTYHSSTWPPSRDEGKIPGQSLSSFYSSDTSRGLGRWSDWCWLCWISWLCSVWSRGLDPGAVIGWFCSKDHRCPWPCSVACMRCRVAASVSRVWRAGSFCRVFFWERTTPLPLI